MSSSMLRSRNLWKKDWPEARQHFVDWWNRDGFVFGAWDLHPADSPHAVVADPGKERDVVQFYADPVWRARHNRFGISKQAFPADVFPVANCDIGPGSLGTFLGAEPNLTYATVWYKPWISDPDAVGTLRFDPSTKWYRIHEELLKESVRISEGNYFTGLPDLIEGLDTLAALRDNEALMMDLVERPEWVKEKVREINQVWFAAYERMYDIVKFDDGGSTWGGFRLWGPGKTAKLQCDASAMISPAMFEEFVVPALAEQCEWLDYSVYHLDGTQAVRHLDALLSIDELDCIEWTPQAGQPMGGSPKWYDMYRKILAAGKCVQAIDVEPSEVLPLLDACGTKGMMVMTSFADKRTTDELVTAVERYR